MATPTIDLSEWERLSPNEKLYLKKAIDEAGHEGTSQLIHALWEADYATTPVSIDTFLTDDYFLGKEGRALFPRWREDLRIVCDPKNQIAEWILAGGIGIGKTWVAVISLVYKLYELTCRRNPQAAFGLAEGSPLVFAFFNIFKYLAMDMSYGYFWTFLKSSPYFKNLRMRAKNDKEEITELTKNIRTVVGAVALHALGMNIFSGILDEMNFGRGGNSNDPENKGQVEKVYIGVRDRIKSRFLDPVLGSYPGLLCLVSSHGDQEGFLSKHIEKVGNDPHTYISSYALWDVKPNYEEFLGPQNRNRRFVVLVGDKNRKSEILEDGAELPTENRCVEVPDVFRASFEQDIDTALQNIAGVATWGSKNLISHKERFHQSIIEGTSRVHPFTVDTPRLGVAQEEPTLIGLVDKPKLVRVADKSLNTIRPIWFPESDRFIHVDLAKNRDAAGISMGCINGSKELVRHDSEGKEFKTHDWTFWVDFMLRIKAARGDEIDFGKIRQFITYLRDQLRFPVALVSADQYQSVQMLQDLRKQGFKTKQVSVDKTTLAYDMLKLLHMECRIDMYPYQPYIDEALRLKDITIKGRRKVDHPIDGSKDVSDSLAGCVFDAFETLDSETVPPVVNDPALLRRPRPVQMMDVNEQVIPPGYGDSDLKKIFGK
jgi:hypothetical protein